MQLVLGMTAYCKDRINTLMYAYNKIINITQMYYLLIH